MEFKSWLFRNLISFGIGAGVLILAILILGSDLSGRADKIKSQRLDLAARLQSFGSLVALRSDAKKSEKLLSQLQESLPTKDQLFGFSKTLESIAKNNKLAFGFTFESEKAGTESSPGVNYFNLTSGGSYGNLIRFFQAIEVSRYFVSFDSLDLISRGKDFELVAKGKVFSQ